MTADIKRQTQTVSANGGVIVEMPFAAQKAGAMPRTATTAIARPFR
jgi:hypothetical protein